MTLGLVFNPSSRRKIIVRDHTVHVSYYEYSCKKFTMFFNLITEENIP